MDTLKKTDQGVVLVTTNTTETESPLSSEELKRQIQQHCEVISDLEQKLKAVQEFEKSEDVESTVTSVEVTDSIINSVALDSAVDVKIDGPIDTGVETPIVKGKL